VGPTYDSAGIRSGIGGTGGGTGTCPPDFTGWQIAGGGSTWQSGTGLTVECTGIIPDCCPNPFVSGDAVAQTAQSLKMGVYALVSGSLQAGRPVWQNSQGSFLYFSQARWHMGPRCVQPRRRFLSDVHTHHMYTRTHSKPALTASRTARIGTAISW